MEEEETHSQVRPRQSTNCSTILVDRLIKNYNKSTSKNLSEYVEESRSMTRKKRSRSREGVKNAFKRKMKHSPLPIEHPESRAKNNTLLTT